MCGEAREGGRQAKQKARPDSSELQPRELSCPPVPPSRAPEHEQELQLLHPLGIGGLLHQKREHHSAAAGRRQAQSQAAARAVKWAARGGVWKAAGKQNGESGEPGRASGRRQGGGGKCRRHWARWRRRLIDKYMPRSGIAPASLQGEPGGPEHPQVCAHKPGAAGCLSML